MFKWEPIEKLISLPPDIQSKVHRVLMGLRKDGGEQTWVAYYMPTVKRWTQPTSFIDDRGNLLNPKEIVQPTHFMLIENLPE